jgi:hypothetical protein
MSNLLQELLPKQRALPGFQLAELTGLQLEPQTPTPSEVYIGNETIKFLNRGWVSPIFVCSTNSSTALPNTPSNNFADTFRQVAFGILDILLRSPSPQATTPTMIVPERRGQFREMTATLNGFVALAKEAIPEMRELTLEERKDLKLFFKKTYRKF